MAAEEDQIVYPPENLNAQTLEPVPTSSEAQDRLPRHALA